jgi:hypothetical protein
MNIINQLANCNTPGGNTGYGSCFNNITFIKGALFVPAGVDYSATDLATLKAALEAGILQDDPLQRIYPVGGFKAVTDNTSKAAEQTFADGSISIVRPPFYDWSFQFTDGGLCLSVALQRANGLNRWVMFYDDQGRLYGRNGVAADTIRGVDPNLGYTPPFTLNDGSKVTVYETRINFSADQLNVNAAVIDFGAAGVGLSYLTGLTGLQDVTLYQAAARASGVVKIGAKTSCGTVDLHIEFATALADTGAWQARNTATKKPIAISSVADDPTDLGWTITLTTADANYSAAAGGVEISLAGPTELDGLDVTGYESNWIAQ